MGLSHPNVAEYLKPHVQHSSRNIERHAPVTRGGSNSVSERRQLPRRQRSASEALALARPNTSPSGSTSGAPSSDGINHTLSVELATARCRVTDSTPHQRHAQPWAAKVRTGGDT